MYNLHCHTLLSDGCLLPSEVAMRYLSAGYRAIAITDHADYSNIDSVVSAALRFCLHWPKSVPIRVLPGVELTHLPPQQFAPLARYCRKQGIKVIIAHGQTVCEPVIKGTNLAALEADIDILAHPGFIADSEVRIAAKKKIFLEVTSRKGHSSTNDYVVERALKFKAPLILNNDSHSPEDIITPAQLIHIGRKAGLLQKEITRIFCETESFIKKREGRQ